MYFHFSKIFWFFIPFGILVLIYAWSRFQRRRDLAKLGEWKLIKDLVPVDALIRRKKKDVMALLGLFILIFSAAGPQFGSRLKEVKQRGVDVFIAMDTSRSMLAEDVVPSRLSRAKRALSLLIQKLEGNRVGIIAFAKFAVMQCPLTVDNQAARIFLDILDINTVPQQGTSIGDAIRLAVKSFPENDKGGKAIVLLTDGEDHKSDPVGAAELAKENGIVLFTIGIGTTKGEVIKKRDDRGKVSEFHKFKGEMVLSRLDDALLTKIATLTGGEYFRASSTDKEIDEIAEYLNGFDKKEFASKVYERLKERYQIFALIAFLLLLFEFIFAEKPGQWARFMSASSWKRIFPLFVVLFFLPQLGMANIKDHVIKGNRLIKKGDIEAGRGEFESAQIDAPEAAFLPYNIANTYYMEGNFEEAKVQYEQAFRMANDPDLKSKIAYNQGHLLFHMNNRSGAIEKFKECLKLNPKDVDAKYNIEYIKSGKQPKSPPQQKKDNKGGDKGDENKDQNESSEQQNQQQEQKKEGDISKEDAERILELIEGQETDNLKDQKPARLFKPPKDKKEQQSYEDW